jgi:cyclic pyranopterin phosphate synthase
MGTSKNYSHQSHKKEARPKLSPEDPDKRSQAGPKEPKPDSPFTHLDAQGQAIMVDVSPKDPSLREALAEGCIEVGPEILAAIKKSEIKKGDVLGVARVAGIMAAKKTAELIPLCHPVFITSCHVNFSLDENGGQVKASCRVKSYGQTGVEMEALTGVSAALLAIYDMCKALDKGMVIGPIRLLEKSGGKSGHFLYDAPKT